MKHPARTAVLYTGFRLQNIRLYLSLIHILVNERESGDREIDGFQQLAVHIDLQRVLPCRARIRDRAGMAALMPDVYKRQAFTKLHSVCGESEADCVGQFFHIMETVSQTRGCCEVAPGEFERTIYTSCWNAARGIYYYTTYGNRRITAVDLHREPLDSTALRRYPMLTAEDILVQNGGAGG